MSKNPNHIKPVIASQKTKACIIGAGPSGLMAAEILSQAGFDVDVFDAMTSVGRKFLMAGRGGLNLTNSEELETFCDHYGQQKEHLKSIIDNYPPQALIKWADDLGAQTFVGSSGRVFPKSLKASPLLRSWLKRLAASGVNFHMSHNWMGWTDQGALTFENNDKTINFNADYTVLALGGASWPKLGSNAKWVDILAQKNIDITAFEPSNMGFTCAWSDFFAQKFSGTPLKNIALTFGNKRVLGEVMITTSGLEGGAIYALSPHIREEIKRNGFANIYLDLKPAIKRQQIAQKLSNPPKSISLSNHLRKALNLTPVAISLLNEIKNEQSLPQNIKGVMIRLTGSQSIDRAISSAGGVKFESLTPYLELTTIPQCYVVGEMLNWEAPTGGYLLQACFSTAVCAAQDIIRKISP